MICVAHIRVVCCLLFDAFHGARLRFVFSTDRLPPRALSQAARSKDEGVVPQPPPPRGKAAAREAAVEDGSNLANFVPNAAA